MKTRLMLVALCALVLVAQPGRAEDEPEVKFPARDGFREVFDKWNTDEVQGRHVKVTVSPAELPYPLLKYRFNTYVTEMESGNAAPLYSEAYSELCRQRARLLKENVYQSEEYARAQWPQLFGESDEKSGGWIATGRLEFKAFPVPQLWNDELWTEIDVASEENLYKSDLKQVCHLIEKGSRKRECDWGYIIEHKGVNTLLEHIHQMRELARCLQGKANWEIRNGKYDDAVKTIRLGLRLSEHVQTSEFPCLVTTLTGIAIQNMMYNEIHLLAAQPDAPNLYPALTQIITRPDVLQKSLQAEQYWLFSRPNIQDVFERIDTADDDEYRMLLEEIITLMIDASDMTHPSYDFENPVRQKNVNNLTALACIACYPYGKERLIRQGFSSEEIDQMSVYRVVTSYVLEEIKAAYDLLIVNASFPAGSSHTAIVFDDSVFAFDSPVTIYLSLLIPAVESAKRAFVRMDQSLDLLKIAEAVRYYAAVHDGKLPVSLDAIEELYVPTVNPVDGKPYGYRVEGNRAVVDFYIYGNGDSRLEIVVE